MIHEYALEPELVATWHERMLGRFFIEQFGFGTGRVVSRYPKNWRKRVWDAFRSGAIAGEIEQKRIEELLARLTAPEVRRPGHIWDAAHDWLTNAESEHARKPFYTILARNNPRASGSVMLAEDVLSGTPAGWGAPNSVVVPRTAGSMAQCIEAMLRCATRVIFVDPHFRASRPKFRSPLIEFLRIIGTGDPSVALELHAGHVADDAPPWDFFRRECEEHLPRIVPNGLTLVVRRWKNRNGGERLHNRYILTDVGGVQFGFGLDEGDPGTTDDVTLLSADSYRRRLESYTGPTLAFELEGEVAIKGQARP